MSAQAYTAVSGSWRATSPTGTGTATSADASWIGIGGVSSTDLIQVGTENTVSASGTVSSAVFYELLPAAPVYPSGIVISPGDSMSASIVENFANNWTITIADTTTSKTYTITTSYTSTHSSAEWVQEDPSYTNNRLVPFDYFGTIPFEASSASYAGTTTNLIAGNAHAIQLVDSANKPVATPSVIGSDGGSFSVTRN